MDSRLTQVVNTLNLIEVQGKDNLNRLLGCILVLEDIIANGEDIPSDDVIPDPAEYSEEPSDVEE